MLLTLDQLTEEQKQEIITKYQTGDYSCKDLSKYYQLNQNRVSIFLKSNGVLVRNNKNKLQSTYSINQNYFNVIDTEEKAYFLGLLYADGSNVESREWVSMFLQEEDKYILEKLSTAVETDKPLIYRPKKQPQHKDAYGITFYNKHMSQSLAKLGCIQNKTFTLTFPTEEQVPSFLIRHFIRGMWDGDGSFHFGTHGNKQTLVYRANLIGTLDICGNIQQIITKNIGISSQVTFESKYRNTTRTLSIGGNIQTQKLAIWLYSDATIYFERKLNKLFEYQANAKQRGFKLIPHNIIH